MQANELAMVPPERKSANESNSRGPVHLSCRVSLFEDAPMRERAVEDVGSLGRKERNARSALSSSFIRSRPAMDSLRAGGFRRKDEIG